MYSICKYIVHILIDPRSINSFILRAFAQYLNVVLMLLNFTLVVSTPTNGNMLTNIVYKSCIIEFTGKEFDVILYIRNFDVIL